CQYRVSMLPYFLEKLKNTKEADASLLDRTMIIWGSPMADANIHNHRRCPFMLLGHANGHLKGNLHIKAPDGTPMANVMLSLLHMLGPTWRALATALESSLYEALLNGNTHRRIDDCCAAHDRRCRLACRRCGHARRSRS